MKPPADCDPRLGSRRDRLDSLRYRMLPQLEVTRLEGGQAANPAARRLAERVVVAQLDDGFLRARSYRDRPELPRSRSLESNCNAALDAAIAPRRRRDQPSGATRVVTDRDRAQHGRRGRAAHTRDGQCRCACSGSERAARWGTRANFKMVDRFCQPFSSNTSRNKGVSQALVTCASGQFVDNLCARRPRRSA